MSLLTGRSTCASGNLIDHFLTGLRASSRLTISRPLCNPFSDARKRTNSLRATTATAPVSDQSRIVTVTRTFSAIRISCHRRRSALIRKAFWIRQNTTAQLFDGACGALANKAVAMALDGDAVALRLCIGRIIAPRRHRPTSFALPPLRSAADLAPAMAAIAEATISTSEAWE